MADDVTLNIRTRGARRAARDVDQVTGSLGRLGRGGRVAAGGLQVVGTSTARAAGNGLGYVGDKAKYAAVGIGLLATVAGRSGIQFNASMEQNQVAFTNFLGSAAAARRELAFLTDLEAKTPFELTQITAAARRLLAFNFTAKDTNSWLMSISDAASGAGVGADGIERMITAIGQMKSKGRLQTEELMQLQELGLVDYPALRKSLGLTADEMANLGAQNISSAKGLRILKKQWDDQFGGQSAKQAKTWNGQVSTLRSNLDKMFGRLSKPVFDWGRKDVLPALNSTADQINSIMGRDDIDLGQKLTLSRRALRRGLGPLADEVSDQIDEMQVGPWLNRKVEEGTPVVIDAVGTLGRKAVGAFAEGWWNAGPWGKLITAGFLGAKLGLIGPAAGGAFGWAGKKAAGQFRKSWRSRIGKLPAPVAPAVPLPLTPFPTDTKGRKPGFWAGAWSKSKSFGGKALRGGGGIAIASGIANIVGSKDADPLAILNPESADAGRDGTPVAELARRAARSSRGRGRAAAPPPRRDTVIVLIDGKPVAAQIVRNHGRTLERGARRAREDDQARK